MKTTYTNDGVGKPQHAGHDPPRPNGQSESRKEED